MQIQNLIKMISQDWRKSTAQLPEGNADPDHYAVATHYLKCFCAPRELAEQTVGSCRLQSEVSFIFSLSVVPGRRARPNTAYSAEKVQVLLKKMFLEAPSQLKHNSSLYICTDTQTPQLQPLNWWQVVP